MKKTINLLPTAVRPSLPWPRSELRSIELPSGVHIPTGALQKSGSNRSLLQNPLHILVLVGR